MVKKKKKPRNKGGRLKRIMLRERLESLLRERLCAPLLRLCDFETESSRIVYRAEMPDGKRLFVKFVPLAEGERLKLLGEELELPFVARVEHLLPLDDGKCAVCCEWQTGEHIPPEYMNEAQCAALVEANARLRKALKPSLAQYGPRDIDECFDAVRDFAKRHPLSRPFLHSLLSIPAEDRTEPPERLEVSHGDFHYLNYMFSGDRISAIVDFASVRPSLPVQDLAFAFVRRYFKAKLPKAELANIDARFRQAVAAMPYPASDWRVAVNSLRLMFAMRRLKAHPHFALAATIVYRRDLALRHMLSLIG